MAQRPRPTAARRPASAKRPRGPFQNFLNFTTKFVRLHGKVFKIDDRPYLDQIYNSTAPRLVLRASRQVEKSTLLSNRIVYDVLRTPGLRILFCCPRHDQASLFSRTRLQPLIQGSPLLKQRLWPHKRPMPVYDIRFENGSEVYVRAAFHNADAARGISADILVVDEFQDLANGALNVLQETLSHSNHRRLILAGTPKWLENHLETAFQQSTVHEWHVNCEHCQRGLLLNERTLGLGFLACPECRQQLNAAHGRWIPRNPQSTWGDGFTINHLMVPWLSVPEILERQAYYDRVTFLNEVLGLPATLGDHIITREEIEACCDDRRPAQELADIPANFHRQLVLGVDWGGGVQSGTVAILGYPHGERHFTIVRLDRWRPREDPPQVTDDVFGLCQRFRVRIVAADDLGNGLVYNRMLLDRLRKDGLGASMWGIKYGPDMQAPQKHLALTEWLIGRTQTIGGLFTRIKLGLIRFPRAADCGSFLDEFTCELAEYNDEMRIVKYTKPDDRRDDALHATNYGEMVAMRLHAARRG